MAFGSSVEISPGGLPYAWGILPCRAAYFWKAVQGNVQWFQELGLLEHADEWILFPKDTDPHLAIIGLFPSNGESCAFVTNLDRNTSEESPVAAVQRPNRKMSYRCPNKWTRNPWSRRGSTLGLSDSMHKTVAFAFPKAERVMDCFHVQELVCDAVREIRATRHRDTLRQSNGEIEECEQAGNHTRLAISQTGTPARSHWSEADVYRSNLQEADGKNKGKGVEHHLRNILVFKRLTGCHVP